MDSGKFRLPGKKQLDQQPNNWQVIVVDVTESPIERPKKSRELYCADLANYLFLNLTQYF